MIDFKKTYLTPLDGNGLHVSPAGAVVRAGQVSGAEYVQVRHNGNRANGLSILGLLSMAVLPGQKVHVTARVPRDAIAQFETDLADCFSPQEGFRKVIARYPHTR